MNVLELLVDKPQHIVEVIVLLVCNSKLTSCPARLLLVPFRHPVPAINVLPKLLFEIIVDSSVTTRSAEQLVGVFVRECVILVDNVGHHCEVIGRAHAVDDLTPPGLDVVIGLVCALVAVPDVGVFAGFVDEPDDESVCLIARDI